MLSQELLRFLPFRDLSTLNGKSFKSDLLSAGSVLFLSVPQGVAYAIIAGLPPAMGLYAGALPAIFGSLLRSSRHVITGPTNALSLLVGTAVAASASHDPVAIAAILALIVGLFQLTAGFLKLGALVDYISSAVVLGYVTGAGVLVGAGQLGNITSTPMGTGRLSKVLSGWWADLGSADSRTVGIALATAGGIILIRKISPKIPGPMVLIVLAIITTWIFDLGAAGIPLIKDLAPIASGLPPFAMPQLELMPNLLSMGIAATVLSLVESSAVGRTIAGRTGQKLDTSVEFTGQGFANISAAFFGGYPVSGSLARSMLNEKAGAETRLSGAMTGVFMLTVLLFLGPVINLTPIASLAGLILIIAIDLIDVDQIRTVMRSNVGDRLAFAGTVIGTWTLSLDQAIYLGVGISLFLFLRRVRLVTVHDMVVSQDNRLRELVPPIIKPDTTRKCPVIRAVHVEGPLFFGAANELANALDVVVQEPEIRVLIVRLKRARGLDYTSAQVLERAYRRMNEQNKTMILVGMTPDMMDMLIRMGVTQRIAKRDLFPTQPDWFDALNEAIASAAQIAGEHSCGDDCPMTAYLEKRRHWRHGTSPS